MWIPSALLLLTAPAARAFGEETPGASKHEDAATIYVARRRWHVDVGFDAADLLPQLRFTLHDLPHARYVFFGFGNRGFLTASRRRAPAFLAALWPGKGLILATGLHASPAESFGADQVVELRVSRDQSRRAQEYITGSLLAAPMAIPGPYEGSVYYDALPKYSAAHTCNTWAAEVLAGAGLPVHSSGVVFAGQLWRRVRSLAGASQQGGLVPSAHTTAVPESGGTTTVVFSGGGGLLLLMQPPSMKMASNRLEAVLIGSPSPIAIQ